LLCRLRSSAEPLVSVWCRTIQQQGQQPMPDRNKSLNWTSSLVRNSPSTALKRSWLPSTLYGRPVNTPPNCALSC
jgi:hypothetical protein